MYAGAAGNRTILNYNDNIEKKRRDILKRKENSKTIRVTETERVRFVSQQPQKAESSKKSSSWHKQGWQVIIVLCILALTFICFSPALSSKKQFINFDDPVYITKQDLITKLDVQQVKKIFSDHDASLNYHPLTVLSLAFTYHFSKLQPFGYFFTNVFIHVLNTLLVFIFIYQLTVLGGWRKDSSSVNNKSKIAGNRSFWVAAITAVFFGIHPMHVESVAWASERKDVLYCFFFLLSCIAYLSFISSRKIFFLIVCFFLFLLSCLSKAMAVPLPLVLLLIDYYVGRKISFKVVAEKVPFFVISLVLGYAAVKIQSKGAISDFHQYTLAQKFMFAAYGFMMYWSKLFAPVNLSAFYPYPTLNEGGVSAIFKVALVTAPLIIAVPLFITYKKNRTEISKGATPFRVVLFGLGFFILMVTLVLQFLSVGAAIMADRYSYLPYIGAFFMIASFLATYIEKSKTKYIAFSGVVIITLLLAVTCYARVQVWNDDEKLWSDVIEKYPYVTENDGNIVKVKEVGVDIAYENRANYYRDHNEPDKAMADYEVLTRLHSKADGAYNNMGNFYGMKAQEAAAKGNSELANQFFSKALEMYSEAIQLKPGNAETIMNRAITYSAMGNHAKAIEEFGKALQMNPSAINLYSNLAFEKLQMGLYSESIEDCNRLLTAKPDDAMVLFYRGTNYINTGKYNEAVTDLNHAVEINPSLSNAWFNLSLAYNKGGHKQEAMKAALKAKSAGFAVSDQYLQSLQK